MPDIGSRRRGSPVPGPHVLTMALGAALLVASGAPALAAGQDAEPAQGQGRLACKIKENGTSASGTVVVRSGGEVVERGSCSDAMRLPAGSYRVVLRLDGALDRPEQTRSVTIGAGKTAEVEADFPTGILEVRIEAGGRRAPGTARIMRGGERVGTLGGGVEAHISAGTYEIVVRYRTEEKTFDNVRIAAGERRSIQAKF